MVATAPGEKLLIGRRPVRNWTRRMMSSLFFVFRKLHLFLGKSTKAAATRDAVFDSIMHQIVCLLGLPLWELTALPRPQLYLGGLLLEGGEGTDEEGRGREGERRGEDMRGEEGRRGEGRGGREFALALGRKKVGANDL